MVQSKILMDGMVSWAGTSPNLMRLSEKPALLENVSPVTGHWIALCLVGTRSNRDGIGAMVLMAMAAGEQWNRVRTAVGYASSSDRIVHFGLGRLTESASERTREGCTS
jgi:hypothetical protein